MKRGIIVITILLTFATHPLMANEAHHPGTQTDPATTQMNNGEMDTSVQQMQEMRKKIETEKDPAIRKDLMHQHMQMMQNGMNMMGMMGGQGMMGDQGMMGGASSRPMDNRMEMMEKKVMMMEEMLNGMMTQQKMMMK